MMFELENRERIGGSVAGLNWIGLNSKQALVMMLPVVLKFLTQGQSNRGKKKQKNTVL